MLVNPQLTHLKQVTIEEQVRSTLLGTSNKALIDLEQLFPNGKIEFLGLHPLDSNHDLQPHEVQTGIIIEGEASHSFWPSILSNSKILQAMQALIIPNSKDKRDAIAAKTSFYVFPWDLAESKFLRNILRCICIELNANRTNTIPLPIGALNIMQHFDTYLAKDEERVIGMRRLKVNRNSISRVNLYSSTQKKGLQIPSKRASKLLTLFLSGKYQSIPSATGTFSEVSQN